jgi:hypothetical protein
VIKSQLDDGTYPYNIDEFVEVVEKVLRMDRPPGHENLLVDHEIVVGLRYHVGGAEDEELGKV